MERYTFNQKGAVYADRLLKELAEKGYLLTNFYFASGGELSPSGAILLKKGGERLVQIEVWPLMKKGVVSLYVE